MLVLLKNPGLALIVLSLWLTGGVGQAQEFHTARPGRTFSFPRDHGSHPEFKTEWWYYSGHLKAVSGETFGYQLTFFRVALARPNPAVKSAWATDTIYFAHLALTDATRQKFSFYEKAQRGALNLAGADTGRLKVWIDGWQAEMQGDSHHLTAQSPNFTLNLTLSALKPPVLHGEAGYSRKSATAEVASHYYSITRLATRGQLTLGNKALEVTGTSWLDREFSSGQMAPNQAGWDWFALQLADGTDIMLYLMRLKNGGIDPASSGTLVDSQGKAHHLKFDEFVITPKGSWKSPRSGAVYPSGWSITLPRHGCNLSLTPTLPDQELSTGEAARLIYWEGQVNITGSKNGRALSGQGYEELTGYAGSLGGGF